MEDPLGYLMSLPRFDRDGGLALKPGLDRIRALLELVGRPHEAYRSIHVAGTNGKGSTASFIASVASACGFRVGLHTSPHIWRVGELMRVNGLPADQSWIAESILKHWAAFERIGPSFFEATVALSLLYFAESTVDVAVVEVGLGGRLDATNVIWPDVSVITNVSLEHQQFLGSSLRKITVEKAGIIKSRVPVVAAIDRSLVSTVRRVAADLDAPFHYICDEMTVSNERLDLRGSAMRIDSPLGVYEEVYLGLAGRHQILNAVTAVRTAEIAFPELLQDQRPIFTGLRHVREFSGIRGRLEVIRTSPLIVADVAHNPPGVAAAVEHLRSMGRLNGRFEVLFGAMSDKDVHAMSRVLASAGAVVRPVLIDSPRAVPAAELVRIMRVSGIEVADSVTVDEGIRTFLSDAAHSDTLLVTGSHLVVAQLEDALL